MKIAMAESGKLFRAGRSIGQLLLLIFVVNPQAVSRLSSWLASSKCPESDVAEPNLKPKVMSDAKSNTHAVVRAELATTGQQRLC